MRTPSSSSSVTPAAATRAGSPSTGVALAPRSSRKRVRFQLAARQAVASALYPALFRAFSGAPASSSIAAMVASPQSTAPCSAVLPSPSTAAALAPLARRVMTASARPCQLSREAARSALRPACTRLTSAPRVINARNRRTSGISAANTSTVRWSRSPMRAAVFASAPASSRARARSTSPPRAASSRSLSSSAWGRPAGMGAVGRGACAGAISAASAGSTRGVLPGLPAFAVAAPPLCAALAPCGRWRPSHSIARSVRLAITMQPSGSSTSP